MDFGKAFDSVWYKELMYKLLSQYYTGGKVCGILNSIYRNAKSCVGRILTSFKLQKVITHGDKLSPCLFNLYLNDINTNFTSKEHEVKCLLYTDDLSILSETVKGVQYALNKL